MIQKGSTVVLQTKDAIYCTCKIIAMSEKNITVTYLAGTRKDKKTGKSFENRPVETIPCKKIISISERL